MPGTTGASHDDEEGRSEPLPGDGKVAAEESGFAETRSILRPLGTALRHDMSAAGRRVADRLRRRPTVPRPKRLPRARSSAWVRALRGIALIAVVGLVAVIAIIGWALRDIPWKEIADGSLKPVVVLETADGQQLVAQGPYQGAYATRKDFPQHLIDAVLAAEDRRFREHFGVDLRGIGRALFSNIKAGTIVQGGSTITQQLVKINYLEQDRTFKRKIQEAVIALWLEQKLDKDEILTRYLNNIYLGAGATGMPAAARVYFDKDVSELSLGESAMLAGLIRAPSQLNPLENPEGARKRTETVLNTMVADGRLDEAQTAEAKQDFAQLRPTKPAARSGSWFADWVSDEAREIAGPYRGTIKVRTSLSPRLQVLAEKVVKEALDREGAAAGASQAALVAMTPDGGVVAMVGGRDYGDSEFNRAVTALRQPGSAFKLFTYYAAIKAGISLDDQIEDGPIKIGDWEPENYNGEYRGMVTVAEAFARSLNAATVALAMKVGIGNVIAAARELGIDTELKETPSVVLGSYGVSLLDITGAYASVRAGRAPIEPWGIASFHADGQPRAFSVKASKQPDTNLLAYQGPLVQLLQLVVEEGTGKAAALEGFAAGKTGTSQNFRDAWFIGFTEPLVAGVWVGNDDETPMDHMTGGKLPAEIWRNFMTGALAELATAPPQQEIAPPPATEVPPPPVTAEEEPAIVAIEEDAVPASEVPLQVPLQPDEAGMGNARDTAPLGEVPSRDPLQPEEIGAAEAQEAAAPVATAPAQPAQAVCNYRVCSSMYRSFRESDCTYQPFSGPRRVCTASPIPVGEAEAAPASQAPDQDIATASDDVGIITLEQARSGKGQLVACNYRACSRSYRSFRPSDCTYQPYGGPRQLCER